MITARLSLVQRTSVSTAKPSSAAAVRDSGLQRVLLITTAVGEDVEPVGSSAAELFDGLPDGAVVTDGFEADRSRPGQASQCLGRDRA